MKNYVEIYCNSKMNSISEKLSTVLNRGRSDDIYDVISLPMSDIEICKFVRNISPNQPKPPYDSSKFRSLATNAIRKRIRIQQKHRVKK